MRIQSEGGLRCMAAGGEKAPHPVRSGAERRSIANMAPTWWGLSHRMISLRPWDRLKCK